MQILATWIRTSSTHSFDIYKGILESVSHVIEAGMCHIISSFLFLSHKLFCFINLNIVKFWIFYVINFGLFLTGGILQVLHILIL